MRQNSWLLSGVLLIILSAASRAGAQDVSGNWVLAVISGGNTEQTRAVFRLKTDSGKTTGEVDAAATPGMMLQSVELKGNMLRIESSAPGGTAFVFEGVTPKDFGKRILGTLTINGTLNLASLSAHDENTADAKKSRRLDCPPFDEARALLAKVNTLRFRAQQSKDEEQKSNLQKQAAEADQIARKETPRLYREVVAKFADNPAIFEALLSLAGSTRANEVTPDELKKLLATAAKSATAYGPRWETEFTTRVASSLMTQEGFAAMALDLARRAEGALTDSTPAADQVRVLSLLGRALRKTGAAEEAKRIDGRVAKFDEILDREYLAKMPPFKGETFLGRKSSSERTVFMELFTGATCPPCVAADLAFDVLQTTYKPIELVLVQYHVHIPGPDPMTNPATEARWKYYRTAFPKAVLGAPTSVFSGKPAASGGGAIANAEKKYEAYRKVIDPLLEDPASAKVAVQAMRKGDRIDIHVEVSQLADPSPNKKLRIVLAEGTVRFAGSNKIRLHHNVVRAFPGGVEGTALTNASSKHTASIELKELRGQLTSYLDNYDANVRPFPSPFRPLEFANLRAIAFVQDDDTQEILQAAQVAVEGK